MENTSLSLNDEVFVRTLLGAREVANVNSSELPREARTLLILIDGRKNYAQVTRLLENRKMFRDTGGLKKHLKMLIDLDYIKFSNHEFAASNNSYMEMHSEHSEITLFTRADESESDFADSEADISATSSEIVENENQAVDQLRKIIMALIAKHDDSSIVEKYSSRLSECQSMRGIFAVLQKLQAQTSGQFGITLTMAAKAFKNSKVAQPA